MAYNIYDVIEIGKDEMRGVLGAKLLELGKKNKDVMILDADLMGASGIEKLVKDLPDQVINCGIQEANMMGVAAGLSLMGKIPFAHTFAPFATRRAFDQNFLSIGYAKQNVKILATDPGVYAELNGGTHMPFEDMGIMRNIPDATIIEPTDTEVLAGIFDEVASTYGLTYLRLVRRNAAQVYKPGNTFKIGKANLIREGKDVAIIAMGICVSEALKAANILKGQNISASILDMFTLKPIDRKAIVEQAKIAGCVVTAENHNVVNGLGSAVAEVLSEDCPTPLVRVGIQDEFGQVGKKEKLMDYYGMDANAIVEAAKKAIAKKA